jgi:predicted nucleotidyltransferase
MAVRMTTRENLILKRTLGILKKELRPRRIVLFGSRAKGTNRHGSDFDLALDCRKPGFSEVRRVQEKLEEESGLYHIDLVFLSSVSRTFRRLILNTGKVM